MLTKLHLRNFRCFEDHTVEFGPVTALVGPNNAGKSTVIEALRFIALAARRAQTPEFLAPPDWLPGGDRGTRPSLRGVDVDFDGLFHRYGDPPAEIEATFESGATICLYLGGDDRIQAHAVFTNEQGAGVRTRRDINALSLPIVSILPQIGPLQPQEYVLTDQTVREGRLSRLSSLHLRNELRLYEEFVDEFHRLVERGWPGLQAQPLQRRLVDAGPLLWLPIRDGDFVAEAGRMGHGTQMWLQTMWFLAQAPPEATVILDEPDIYMHPDLQLRLMRTLRARYRQCVVSTHSVEIMTEVAPDEVVLIDKGRSASRSLTSLTELQGVINAIGAPHNLALMRLGASRRFLLVEGKDAQLLERFQRVLLPNAEETFQTIPQVGIDGWGGWDWASSSYVPKTENSRGEKILTYCVLDRDYHTDEECAARYARAKQCGISLLIWPRKEIENYLLVPSAIARALREGARKGRATPSDADVAAALMGIADELRDSVIESMAEAIEHRNKGWGLSRCMKEAKGRIGANWAKLDGRLRLIPGKQVLGRLRDWAKAGSGVTLTLDAIIRAMRPDEVAEEMREVVEAISACRKLRCKAAWR